MCSPTALLVAASLLQGASSLQQSESEANQLKFSAKQHESNARIALARADQATAIGKARESELKRQTAAVLAAQVARTAGSGIDIGSGSQQEVFESTIAIGASDILQNQLNTEQEVWGFKAQFSQEKQAASIKRRAAKRVEAFAPIGFVTPIVGSFAQTQQPKAGGKK